jgi:hypothetical protein
MAKIEPEATNPMQEMPLPTRPKARMERELPIVMKPSTEEEEENLMLLLSDTLEPIDTKLNTLRLSPTRPFIVRLQALPIFTKFLTLKLLPIVMNVKTLRLLPKRPLFLNDIELPACT